MEQPYSSRASEGPLEERKAGRQAFNIKKPD